MHPTHDTAESCIFCDIINKKIPTALVYEDEYVIAFNDIAPVAPKHVLIVPRQHIATLNDTLFTPLLAGHIVHTGTRIANNMHIAIPGYRLVWNCNPDGGQAVYHIHLHLIGGRPLCWPPG